jgi:hypothetical protein
MGSPEKPTRPKKSNRAKAIKRRRFQPMSPLFHGPKATVALGQSSPVQMRPTSLGFKESSALTLNACVHRLKMNQVHTN